jgi:hypothetical protein
LSCWSGAASLTISGSWSWRGRRSSA